MKLLLDTHTLFWATTSVAQLSAAARNAIEDEANEVYVSVANAWEIAIKVGLGKWPEAAQLIADFEIVLAVAGLDLLPITVGHVRAAGLMTASHRDPFDRLLAAQAVAEGLTLITADPRLAGLGAPALW